MSLNVDLGKTKITDKIRVSSAAIFYDMGHFVYYPFETWIFSDGPAQRSRQVIHGTHHSISERMIHKTKKVHDYIAKNLLNDLKF